MVSVEVKVWRIVAKKLKDKIFLRKWDFPCLLDYCKVKNYSTYPSPIVDLHRKMLESVENSMTEIRIDMDT